MVCCLTVLIDEVEATPERHSTLGGERSIQRRVYTLAQKSRKEGWFVQCSTGIRRSDRRAQPRTGSADSTPGTSERANTPSTVSTAAQSATRVILGCDGPLPSVLAHG
jgi:hypothetical protein